ncbi:uncharacterized protein LOC128162338 [Crassostrea angulata]|uniref:uncharacterized protein LOC128162338 n=1 Tax=Magallana angulata TaxID=2784310 RepID=UPI0022B16B7E|nr:uncharacterized protein LOC128162338 [Crassostrea angulata]
MQFKIIQKVFVCILTCVQLSRNQQPRCTTYTMNKKFIGSLQEDRAKPLWEIEQNSVGLLMHYCFFRCERDQRCVGFEICTIRPDVSRCRGCCDWYVIDKDGGLTRNTTDGCKYFELSKNIVESKGIRLSAYSNLSAVASSTFMSEQPSYVLDGVYGKGCNAFSSVKEENPWLEITWTETITIWRIIIYNRLNKKGHRLVNLNVSYSNNDVIDICGFYPGPSLRDGDIIIFHCPAEAHATSVKLQIQSKLAQQNVLNLCEVEIYQKC